MSGNIKLPPLESDWLVDNLHDQVSGHSEVLLARRCEGYAGTENILLNRCLNLHIII